MTEHHRYKCTEAKLQPLERHSGTT